MRILAVTNLYPNPFQPQRATFNRYKIRALSDIYPVHVIAPILWVDERKARRAGKTALPQSRRVINDGLKVDHPRYWYTPKILRSWYGNFFFWSVRSTFNLARAEFKPDLIFAPWAYPDGWAVVRLAQRAGLPVVLQVHGSDIRLLDEFRGRKKGTSEALTNADGVIAVSKDLADRAIHLGADPKRVRVVVDGVERKFFCPGDRISARIKLGFEAGVKHLLYVGNLLRVKGVDILLDACVRLKQLDEPWVLHVVGEGALRDQLVNQAASTGLSDRVRFHGSRPHCELPDWFRAADLFVLASRSEGIPNVLLEASACGTPYVATAVGGVGEISKLGASRLVPPENPTTLAETITEVLKAPPSQPQVGPRDKQEAAEEIADFLVETHTRFRSNRT